MKASKKDFEQFAAMVRELREECAEERLTGAHVCERLEFRLCEMLRASNPLFDLGRFQAACKIGKGKA